MRTTLIISSQPNKVSEEEVEPENKFIAAAIDDEEEEEDEDGVSPFSTPIQSPKTGSKAKKNRIIKLSSGCSGGSGTNLWDNKPCPEAACPASRISLPRSDCEGKGGMELGSRDLILV